MNLNKNNLVQKIKKDYRKAIHYLPVEGNSNCRCLNGSVFIKKTRDIDKVTCEKCLNPTTAECYWGGKS